MNETTMPEPQEGDSVVWKRHKAPKLKCWGLVEWIDAEGIHVRVASYTISSKTRTVITPDRIIEVHKGRAVFDSHTG